MMIVTSVLSSLELLPWYSSEDMPDKALCSLLWTQQQCGAGGKVPQSVFLLVLILSCELAGLLVQHIRWLGDLSDAPVTFLDISSMCQFRPGMRRAVWMWRHR
jgi:hypothetical protein